MRDAGRILVVVIVLLGAASVVVSRTRSPRPQRPWVGGTIEFYGDGTIILETPAGGLREVRVDAHTIVRVGDRPPSPPDLRPGRFAIAWVEQETWSGPPVAREIVVWGAGR